MSGPGKTMVDEEAAMLLRRLAVKAVGFSGADVERLVREARGAARREGRGLAWTDLDQLLDAVRPKVTEGLRRRAAVHEAGHAVVRHVLGIGRVVRITIAQTVDAGGFVEATEAVEHELLERRLMGQLAILLAGRVAERELLGSVSAGAGGSPQSDLGKATAMAIRIETASGLGGQYPLLHQTIGADMLLSGLAPGTARRVHRRLRKAERHARRIVARERPAVIDLAAHLLEVETLEGEDLARLLPDR